MHPLPTMIFVLLVSTVLACVFCDRRKRRLPAFGRPLSVVIPCYNDANTVGDSIRSVFAAYPASLLDVIVVDDASTDDSAVRIRDAQRDFPIRVVGGKPNRGKVGVLNSTIPETRNELVLCLDADTMVSPEAVTDMLSRITNTESVGAVSCPYAPLNRGFLPAMQAIEYSMLRFGQGAGNVTSALALWGGCLMLKKAAWEAVGGFSPNAITEDVDLAFKLNRAGRKVEQSFVFVRSHVPDRWRPWFRQKLRWTAGGFQCVFRYPGVWARNPLQVLFVSSYVLLTACWIRGVAGDSSLLQIGRHVIPLWADGVPIGEVARLTDALYGSLLAAKLIGGLVFSSFSLIYVVPTISRVEDWVRIGLIVPFSMAYFPLYLAVSLVGLVFWFSSLRRLPTSERAW